MTTKLFLRTLVLVFTCSVLGAEDPVLPPSTFGEVWAYLMDGEEASFKPLQPITDIGYFGAGVGNSGELVGVPKKVKIPGFKGRVHLVVAEVTSYLASHLVLTPDLPLREAFLNSIVRAGKNFDGVQIDFEKILVKDKEHLYSFLKEIKTRLPDKIISAAVPALTQGTSALWDYSRLGTIIDKVIIMAYDEHWSGSAPGSIASLDWCGKVAKYARSLIPSEKLILGLPFYGRAWVDRNHAKAFRFSTLEKLQLDEKISGSGREEQVPFFEYTSLVKVKVYFEDVISLSQRLALYSSLGIDQVAFWRLGQEDPRIWSQIKLRQGSRRSTDPINPSN